eukprot:1073004_1
MDYIPSRMKHTSKTLWWLMERFHCHVTFEICLAMLHYLQTNLTNNIHYYQLPITQQMVYLYQTYFTITTCCKIAHKSIEQMYHPTFGEAYNTFEWSNDSVIH